MRKDDSIMANEIQRRNNLFDNLMNMRDWMNDDFFSDLTPAADHMKTDVAEDDHGYTVKIDMPGFDKKDIQERQELAQLFSNNILAVTGHRDSFADESDQKGNVLRTERRYGQMSRQYRLPDVDRSAVKARYENGVLTLELPKLQASDENDTRIDID